MKTNKLNRRGFTLIELLVVISIIALLSSIVLAAVSSARLKAQDARVISEMTTLRNVAELYRLSNGDSYNTNSSTNYVLYGPTIEIGGYSNSFLTAPGADGEKITRDLMTLLGIISPSTGTNLFAGITKTSFAVSARLPSSLQGTASYYCIDSSGKTTIKTTYTVGNYPGPFSC